MFDHAETCNSITCRYLGGNREGNKQRIDQVLNANGEDESEHDPIMPLNLQTSLVGSRATNLRNIMKRQNVAAPVAAKGG